MLTTILNYLSKPDLRAISTTCQAAHDLAVPFLLHSVTLRSAMQLSGFCLFLTSVDGPCVPPRVRHLRALTISRRALHFESDLLAAVLARATSLESVALEETEHIVRRHQALALALTRVNGLASLTLDVSDCEELLAEDAHLSLSTFGLLRAHRASLSTVTLHSFVSPWAWDPVLVWPRVAELTLDNAVVPAVSLARAFPNVVRFTCVNSTLTLNPAAALHALAWPKLDSIVADAPGMTSFTLAPPGARRVELLCAEAAEWETVSADVLFSFLRAANPDVAVVPFGAAPTALTQWPRFCRTVPCLTALDADLEDTAAPRPSVLAVRQSALLRSARSRADKCGPIARSPQFARVPSPPLRRGAEQHRPRGRFTRGRAPRRRGRVCAMCRAQRARALLDGAR